MFIKDATGRLPVRLFVAQTINAWQSGVAYDGVAYLVDTGATAATDVFVNGLRLRTNGVLVVTAPAGSQSQATYAGWPTTSEGVVPMYGLAGVVPVPAIAGFNGGIAMDDAGVYADIIP